eukprot:754612-Hanusia_phi.AAC.4
MAPMDSHQSCQLLLLLPSTPLISACSSSSHPCFTCSALLPGLPPPLPALITSSLASSLCPPSTLLLLRLPYFFSASPLLRLHLGSPPTPDARPAPDGLA